MEYILSFILDFIIVGAAMFAACKITGVRIQPGHLVLIILVSSFVSLIPEFGWLASTVVLFWLLNQYSNAKLWPDLVFMVIVSRLLSFFIVGALL